MMHEKLLEIFLCIIHVCTREDNNTTSASTSHGARMEIKKVSKSALTSEKCNFSNSENPLQALT